MILVSHCLRRSRDQSVMSLCELKPITVSCNPVKFGYLRHSGIVKMFLVRQVVLKDHVIKGSCDLVGGNHSC